MANLKINHHHHQQQEVRLEAKKTVVAMAYNEQQRTKGPTTPTHTHLTADTNRNGFAATSATWHGGRTTKTSRTPSPLCKSPTSSTSSSTRTRWTASRRASLSSPSARTPASELSWTSFQSANFMAANPSLLTSPDTSLHSSRNRPVKISPLLPALGLLAAAETIIINNSNSPLMVTILISNNSSSWVCSYITFDTIRYKNLFSIIVFSSVYFNLLIFYFLLLLLSLLMVKY